jgi:uncharacterized protein YbbK (DUF523 family)
MIKIGVSACLLGQKVRYDGKDKFANLGKYFDPKVYQLIPICPEVEMGMSIPRPSIQMRIIDGDTRLVQVDDHKLDFTDQLNKWFDDNKKRFEQFQGFILKSKSPSCGNLTTPHFNVDESFTLKDGLFVTCLKKQNTLVEIIDEKELTKNNLT